MGYRYRYAKKAYPRIRISQPANIPGYPTDTDIPLQKKKSLKMLQISTDTDISPRLNKILKMLQISTGTGTQAKKKLKLHTGSHTNVC